MSTNRQHSQDHFYVKIIYININLKSNGFVTEVPNQYPMDTALRTADTSRMVTRDNRVTLGGFPVYWTMYTMN